MLSELFTKLFDSYQDDIDANLNRFYNILNDVCSPIFKRNVNTSLSSAKRYTRKKNGLIRNVKINRKNFINVSIVIEEKNRIKSTVSGLKHILYVFQS